jgi:hypothetical protein
MRYNVAPGVQDGGQKSERNFGITFLGFAFSIDSDHN